MRIAFFLILFITAGIQSFEQKLKVSSMSLDTWHCYPLPEDSAIIYAYGGDTTSWTSYVEKGNVYTKNTYRLVAREQGPGDSIPDRITQRIWANEKIIFRKGQDILSVDDGFLFAVNRGEWGGRLLWYSKDGRKHYKISNDQIVQFEKRDDKIYAVREISYYPKLSNALLEIRKINNKWSSLNVLELHDPPVGIAIRSNKNFLIGTSNSIIEVKKDGQYDMLYDNAFWNKYQYLYPTSLIVNNDTLYLGMRKGIFRLDLTTGRKDWLMRN